jgi:PKD repeat protein
MLGVSITQSYDPDGTINGATATCPDQSSSGVSPGGPIPAGITAVGCSSADFPGIYPVKLTVTDNAGLSASGTETFTILAAGHAPPTDNAFHLDAGPDITVKAGATARFDFSGSWNGPAGIARVRADFGDGNSSDPWTLFPNVHVYANPGTYTATFTSYDNLGVVPAGVTASVKVTVVSATADAPPVVVLPASATLPYTTTDNQGTGMLGVSIKQSYDPDGTINVATATCPDGSSSGLSPGGPIPAGIAAVGCASADFPGVYAVTLTITDNAGLTASGTETFTILAAGHAPPADNAFHLDAGPDMTVKAGTVARFDFSSSWNGPAGIARARADFGDGTSSDPWTLFPNVHVYSTPGTYTATFTSYDNLGVVPSGVTDSVVVTVTP